MKIHPKLNYLPADRFADVSASDSARKVLLAGDMVYKSMQASATPPKGFIAQMPRDAAGSLLDSFKKHIPKVYVYLHPALFDQAKKRFGLAFDAYLAWGIRQRKGVTVLIGGIEIDGREISIDIMVFEAGRLIALTDRQLPERSSTMFRIGVESIVQQLQVDYPKARIVQAAPLSNWGLPGVEYVTDPIRRASFRPLSRSAKPQNNIVIPAGIVAAGLLINFAMIGSKWSKFEEAQVNFDAALAAPEVSAAGGVDSNYISVMTQRRTFMETPRRQDVLPAKVLQIVRGVGVLPGVQILSLQLPAPGMPVPGVVPEAVTVDDAQNRHLITAERVADAQIRISVPRTEGTALEQAKQVLSQLAASTGMSLRLTQRGYQDEPDGKRRNYTIEGFIHG